MATNEMGHVLGLCRGCERRAGGGTDTLQHVKTNRLLSAEHSHMFSFVYLT